MLNSMHFCFQVFARLPQTSNFAEIPSTVLVMPRTPKLIFKAFPVSINFNSTDPFKNAFLVPDLAGGGHLVVFFSNLFHVKSKNMFPTAMLVRGPYPMVFQVNHSTCPDPLWRGRCSLWQRLAQKFQSPSPGIENFSFVFLDFQVAGNNILFPLK